MKKTLLMGAGILAMLTALIRWFTTKATITSPIPLLEYAEGALDHHSRKAFAVDIYKWTDSHGQPRKISLVKNDRPDPISGYGGYIRTYEYFAGKELRVCTGSSDSQPGFGFLVNHYNDEKGINHWISSIEVPGTYHYAFRGQHHAIHEYKWTLVIEGQPIQATVHWFVANGRDHPLFAINYDLTRAKPNSILADTRSPYGDIGWDGDRRSVVSGVAWGDRYKFRTLGDTLSLQSPWSYQASNTIPYNHMWSLSANAEMGLVQTQTWQQKDAGGYWFYKSWGQHSDGPMPEVWNWTYQLNQYQLDKDPSSKRLAWGANYGAVGQMEYNAYGDDKKLSGYPYQSYSVYVVLGRQDKSAVQQAVADLENTQSVVITGENIVAKSSGPAGVHRPEQVQLQPPGWNHVYGVWDLEQLAQGSSRFKFTVRKGSIQNPIFRLFLKTWDPESQVQLDGRPLSQGRDYLVSYDQDSKVVWLTLIGEFSGTTSVSWLRSMP